MRGRDEGTGLREPLPDRNVVCRGGIVPQGTYEIETRVCGCSPKGDVVCAASQRCCGGAEALVITVEFLV
ncbi:hypothetical protein AV530_018305 [Patagioenas fasciata monilis]|uniref:Uncharacterized protein n=1 Tax=Patagioenas fasciata monilis TaxID=372326 RepID=A0A1V4JST4_PATFA|nr:hypothetical protein AV530_018305 [Patagioenas fasciata monilis]